MDRKELRKIMTSIKNQLKNGIEWEKIQVENSELCNDDDSIVLKSAYTGTITKAEFENNYLENVKSYKPKENFIWICKDDDSIYASVSVHVFFKDSSYEYNNVDICKMNL